MKHGTDICDSTEKVNLQPYCWCRKYFLKCFFMSLKFIWNL